MSNKQVVLIINIVGVFLAIGAGLGLWFTVITGAMDQQKAAQTAYDGVKARADKLPTAKKNLAQAQADKAAAVAAYGVYESQYMPVIGFTGDRLFTMQRLFWANNGRTFPERYRSTLKRYMAAQEKRRGIKCLTDFSSVAPTGPFGPDPNTVEVAGPGEAVKPGVGSGDDRVLHYTYPVQVQAKSLQAVMAHIADWNNVRMAGVPVVEGLSITGNSPTLTASYTLRLTLIMHDNEKIPDLMPRISASGGGTGGGMGGLGGGGMMMPGMPGMGQGRGRAAGMSSGMSMGMPMPGGGGGGPAGMSSGMGMPMMGAPAGGGNSGGPGGGPAGMASGGGGGGASSTAQ